jgi:hypothetical protein
MAIFGPFIVKMYLNNRFKSFLELICFDLVKSNLDLLMGEAQTPHFYDFGIFEPVTKLQNQHALSLEAPGHLKKIKKNHWNDFKHIIL